ncbi:hypothetical protein F9B85_11765 [Heliorestis acidaminivorans]|uniref:Uncharacterized protein n=1 Tax=Heliorestis acidaminivorans TaxID=553427 RepID=A0A6I0F0T4_9FIRM|nr:hypothetical protein [Heliorestis acidaminivorans]KAB2951699.1 hypothetical protein F9B85_11765 [Heliorestis acidaminivorans]
MLFLLITKVQKRLRMAIRLLVLVVLLALLVPQLIDWSTRYASEMPKEEEPSGEPMRVLHPDEGINEGMMEEKVE